MQLERLTNRLFPHVVNHSFGKMPTGKEKNRKWRGYFIRHDVARVRELCGSPQNIPRKVSRSKLTRLAFSFCPSPCPTPAQFISIFIFLFLLLSYIFRLALSVLLSSFAKQKVEHGQLIGMGSRNLRGTSQRGGRGGTAQHHQQQPQHTAEGHIPPPGQPPMQHPLAGPSHHHHHQQPQQVHPNYPHPPQGSDPRTQIRR
jgi:hypothetical protein